jgi:hypothetical protein
MKPVYLLVALCLAAAPALVQAQLLDDNITPEFRSWQAANPWYGADKERTKFAIEYAKQLRKERPGLTGRALLDAVSAAVAKKFDPPK